MQSKDNSENEILISDKILSIRTKNNLSQQDFGEKIGVSRQTVLKWEKGYSSPSMENLITICEVFNISMDYFLKNSDFRVINNIIAQEENLFSRKIGYITFFTGIFCAMIIPLIAKHLQTLDIKLNGEYYSNIGYYIFTTPLILFSIGTICLILYGVSKIKKIKK